MHNRESLIQTVKNFYPLKHKTILAFSGGRDSMILFYIFLEMKKRNPLFDFEAAHLNHLIEGNKEFICRADDFVHMICKEHDVILHYKVLKVNDLAKEKKMTVEEAGRLARYEFFNDLMKKHHCDSFTTAHHRNDQIETLLMRFFKGTGIKGFKGILNINHIKRPLIDVSRDEINLFMESQQCDYMEDPTNSKDGYLRNRIRNQLMPLLDKLFPSYENSLLRFQKILMGVSSLLDEVLPSWKKLSSFGAFIKLNEVLTFNESLLGEIIIKGLEMVSLKSPLTFIHINEIIGFLNRSEERDGNKQILSLQGFTLWRSYDTIYWINEQEYHKYLEYVSFQKMSIKDGHFKIGEIEFLTKKKEDIQIRRLTHFDEILFFDPKRKVSKHFQDQKTPLFLRSLYWGLWVEKKLLGLIDPLDQSQFVHRKLGVIFFHKD